MTTSKHSEAVRHLGHREVLLVPQPRGEDLRGAPLPCGEILEETASWVHIREGFICWQCFRVAFKGGIEFWKVELEEEKGILNTKNQARKRKEGAALGLG